MVLLYCECDNPVAPATVETAATIDSKDKAALAKKFKIQLPGKQVAGSNINWNTVHGHYQETAQGQLSRYISNLRQTWAVVMELSSGLSEWPFTNSTFCQRQHHKERIFFISVA